MRNHLNHYTSTSKAIEPSFPRECENSRSELKGRCSTTELPTPKTRGYKVVGWNSQSQHSSHVALFVAVHRNADDRQHKDQFKAALQPGAIQVLK